MLLWIAFFMLRLIIGSDNLGEGIASQDKPSSPTIVAEIKSALDGGDRSKTFYLIFFNNLKGCVRSIVGGVTLGIGTLFNLGLNGFLTANTYLNLYENGMSISDILKYTLPHSFEMVGVWLSGMVGFLLADRIIVFMRFNQFPESQFYRSLGISIISIVFIILAAAYIEVFVTLPDVSISNY
jgi:stage II sporulation protein M